MSIFHVHIFVVQYFIIFFFTFVSNVSNVFMKSKLHGTKMKKKVYINKKHTGQITGVFCVVFYFSKFLDII